MSGIFALVAVDEAIEAGATRIMLVADHDAIADVWHEVVETFSARAAGFGTGHGDFPEVMVKRLAKDGVPSFATICFQEWKKTPRWSEYWDCIICVRSHATLPSDYQKWTEYLADYLSPGGSMADVWRE